MRGQTIRAAVALLLALVLLDAVPPGAVSAPGVSPSSAATVSALQLVDDPGFEDTGTPPCFVPRAGSGAVVRRTTVDPIAGDRSLRVRLPAHAGVTCAPTLDQPTAADTVAGSLQQRSADRAGMGPYKACLRVALAGGERRRDCTSVPPGSTRFVQGHLDLAGATVTRASWTVTTARRPARAVLDAARIVLTPVGDPVCDPALATPAGPPADGSPKNDNEVPPDSSYTPTAPDFRSTRPFIPLDDDLVAPADDPTAVAFRHYVDRALAGNPDYGYSPADAVVMYARSGQLKYLESAVADVDRQVSAAEHAMAKGKAPVVAGDSYLEAGPMMEELALAYDWGHALLTPDQEARWKRYGDQVVTNVWSPRLATWGDCRPGRFKWSGWSINNPANNYNFSFMQATLLWILATQETPWVDFVQAYKFPLVTNAYEQLPGGGSPEGTGYGTAQRRLWEYARIWAEGTGEHLTAVEDHARDSIEYWVNATVPTLDQFAPVGDLSRESVPNLYDYQENLVREAAMAAPDTPEAGHALWWIAHNSVPDTMANSFNLRGALLRPSGTATKPTLLSYEATGVGQVFTRSAWQPDATWLTAIAGRYDESHAHAEQGSFNLYRDGWLAVTSNIWSHSGLAGNSSDADATGVSNILRFDGPSGMVGQGYATSDMTVTDAGTHIHMDLSPVYADSGGDVTSWTRDLTFSPGQVDVHDACTTGPGVTATWQLHVPVEPQVVTPGKVTAGDLTVSYDPAYSVDLVDMTTVSDDFLSGWRIELRNDADCAFDVGLGTGAG